TTTLLLPVQVEVMMGVRKDAGRNVVDDRYVERFPKSELHPTLNHGAPQVANRLRTQTVSADAFDVGHLRPLRQVDPQPIAVGQGQVATWDELRAVVVQQHGV